MMWVKENMTLTDNPNFQKYRAFCKNKDEKPSLVGYVRWLGNYENGFQIRSKEKNDDLLVTV